MASMNDDSEMEQGEFQEDPSLETNLIRTVLKLEEIDKNLFRGTNLWRPVGGRAVFGGQVVGQALVAASNTKSPAVHVHSLHCYFVNPGKPDHPIVYHVENLRDGRSFSTRIVKAVQRGQVILSMMVSFHVSEESPAQHQYTMPEVPSPESLLTFNELLHNYLQRPNVSEKSRDVINRFLKTQPTELPIETKPVDLRKFHRSRYIRELPPTEPKQMFWVRTKGHIGEFQNDLHRCAAAYISDLSLLGTTLLPIPELRIKMMASLDHSMWFHTHFRVDEWMLYECESPRLLGNRGLTLGRLWKRDGTLAVSVSQEGVVRGKVDTSRL